MKLAQLPNVKDDATKPGKEYNMSWFIFNGTDSRDLGIIVTKTPVRPSWCAEFKEIIIPGANRRYMQKTNNYPNAEFKIDTVVPTDPESLREIYRTLNGSGTLWLSSAPGEYIDVILEALVPEPVAMLTAELPVGVTALPFARSVTPTIVDLTEASDWVWVDNTGTVTSFPEFRFTPSGGDVVLNVNGAEFTVAEVPELPAGAEIVINTEVPLVYWEKDGIKGNIMQYTTGDFPLLHPGMNYIKHSGNVSAASVNVKEAFL